MDFIVGVLCRTTHNGFPVVGSPEGEADTSQAGGAAQDAGTSRQGTLKGLILRSQLLVLISEQVRHVSHKPSSQCHTRL